MTAAGTRVAGVRSFLLAGLLVAVTACSGPGEDDAQDSTPPESGTTSVATPTIAPTRATPSRPALASAGSEGLRVQVHRVVSDRHGFTVVYWTLTNDRDSRFYIPDLFQKRNYLAAAGAGANIWYMDEYMAGVELVIETEGKRYLSLTDPDDNCVCAKRKTETTYLSQGESMHAYNAYYIPADTRTVSVSFPGFDLMKGIPVE